MNSLLPLPLPVPPMTLRYRLPGVVIYASRVAGRFCDVGAVPALVVVAFAGRASSGSGALSVFAAVIWLLVVEGDERSLACIDKERNVTACQQGMHVEMCSK